MQKAKTTSGQKSHPKFFIGLIILGVLSFSFSAKTQAQDNKIILKVAHDLGEIRVCDNRQVVNLNFKIKTLEKTENYPKNEITEKKITETTVTDIKSNAGEKLLVIFNKFKRTIQQGSEPAKEFTDKSEGQKLLLNGDKLLTYRKSQPDSGLIFPEYSIEPGDSWQIQKNQQDKYFLHVYKNENLEVKFTWLKLDNELETTGRIAVIERDLKRVGYKNELKITHITKTLFYVDIKMSRIMRINSSGTIELEGNAKTGENLVATGSITEKIRYSYAKTAMYLLKQKNRLDVVQTEMTNVNIVIKLLVTPKDKPQNKFTMTEIHQTNKVIRRKTLIIENEKTKKYSVTYNRYRSSVKKQNSFNKEKFEQNKSTLEGKTYLVEVDDANKLSVKSENENDAEIVKTLEKRDYQQQYPDFAVPIGYSWQIQANKAKTLFKELFSDLKIDSAVAQVDFDGIEKNAKDEQIAILSLNFGVIGQNKDGLKIKLVVRIINRFNIQQGYLTSIHTDPKLKHETLMKLSFEDDKTVIDGYGSIEINTEYSYLTSSKDNSGTPNKIQSLVGVWEYSISKTAKPRKHILKFKKDGSFTYEHPHLLRNEKVIETGTWVLKENILTIILNEKTDVFEIVMEIETLTLKRILATKNPSSIYPWIQKSIAKYKKIKE